MKSNNRSETGQSVEKATFTTHEVPGAAITRDALGRLKKDSEKRGGESEAILLEKLEKGNLELFDSESVRLLQIVLKDKNATSILSKALGFLGSKAYSVFEFAASKLAGYEGAKYAAEYGNEHTTQQVHEYLSNLVKLDEAGWFVSLKQKINEGVHAVVTPLIDTASSAAGNLAETPYAVGGFFAASAVAGAGLRLYQEVKRSTGFGQIADLIERSQDRIKNSQVTTGGSDPRLDLIVLQSKMLGDKNRMGYKLSNEEWLLLASAVREAKVDLLKDQTKAPAIQLAPGMREAADRQTRAVEVIIKYQQGIVEADTELALEILSQFDRNVRASTDPLKARFRSHNSLPRKAGRYAKAFCRGAIDGTGLPILYKITKTSLKLGSKAFMPL